MPAQHGSGQFCRSSGSAVSWHWRLQQKLGRSRIAGNVTFSSAVAAKAELPRLSGVYAAPMLGELAASMGVSGPAQETGSAHADESMRPCTAADTKAGRKSLQQSAPAAKSAAQQAATADPERWRRRRWRRGGKQWRTSWPWLDTQVRLYCKLAREGQSFAVNLSSPGLYSDARN